MRILHEFSILAGLASEYGLIHVQRLGFGAPTALTGSSPTTGLPANDARRTLRGHQY